MAGEQLPQLYASMHRIRRVEEIIAELYPQQEMRCPVHLCIGQEATPVGVCAALLPTDYVFSTHRSHGHYLAKGGSLPALLGELYGKESGCSGGKGGSMHLVDLPANFLGAAPILGATIALAVGAAFGTRLKGESRVSVVFFGDAAIEEGIFAESASFAVLHRLPVLLVSENNGLSTCSPLSVRQPVGRSACAVARGLGLLAEEGDGNDVLDVLHRARAAVDHVRAGRGPVFLEFKTYRWREHCGPGFDFNLGYRSEPEAQEWKARCPLKRLETHLRTKGLWNDEVMETHRQEIEAEIQSACQQAQSSPFPGPELLLAHEYAP